MILSWWVKAVTVGLHMRMVFEKCLKDSTALSLSFENTVLERWIHAAKLNSRWIQYAMFGL